MIPANIIKNQEIILSISVGFFRKITKIVSHHKKTYRCREISNYSEKSFFHSHSSAPAHATFVFPEIVVKKAHVKNTENSTITWHAPGLCVRFSECNVNGYQRGPCSNRQYPSMPYFPDKYSKGIEPAHCAAFAFQ
jgi:hypothetical protein